MRRRSSSIRQVAFAFAVVSSGLTALPPLAAAEAPVTDQIVVRHRAAATASDRAHVRSDAGVTLDRKLGLTGVEVVEIDGSRAAALADLRRDPDVLWAEPNQPVTAATADPLWSVQYALDNRGTFGVADADVDAPEAWTRSRGSGITVGVVDSGVATAHEDLAGQLVPGVNFVGDGPSAEDLNGHGTHVAGIVAAQTDNSLGVAGGAPLAKVQPLRALDAEGNGSTAWVAAAFDYAGGNGLRVVNASLGSTAPTNVERQAILAHPDTLFVVAAGNTNTDIDAGGATSYPCRYTYENVLCVGASTSSDTAASYSNRGTTSVDLFAPGDQIASTYPASGTRPNGEYVYLGGTSMASPLVAAAAALLASQNPSWTASQLKAQLLGTVDHPAALAGRSVTGGRLNTGRALGVDVGRDGEAPAQVVGLVATPGVGRVDLAWTPSAAHDLQDYRVWVQSGGAWMPQSTVTAPNASITGLSAGATVTVRVTARDRTGEESVPSMSANAAALPGVAPPATTPPATTPVATTPPATSGATPPAATSPGAPATPDAPDAVDDAPAGDDEGDSLVLPLPDLAAPDDQDGAAPAPARRAVSQLTNLRVAKVGGRPRGVRFHLSAAGTVQVTATRRRSARLKAATRARKLSLPAGPAYLAFDRSARGFALPKGTWHLSLAAEQGRRGVTLAVR